MIKSIKQMTDAIDVLCAARSNIHELERQLLGLRQRERRVERMIGVLVNLRDAGDSSVFSCRGIDWEITMKSDGDVSVVGKNGVTVQEMLENY